MIPGSPRGEYGGEFATYTDRQRAAFAPDGQGHSLSNIAGEDSTRTKNKKLDSDLTQLVKALVPPPPPPPPPKDEQMVAMDKLQKKQEVKASIYVAASEKAKALALLDTLGEGGKAVREEMEQDLKELEDL